MSQLSCTRVADGFFGSRFREHVGETARGEEDGWEVPIDLKSMMVVCCAAELL